jgi:hypothetical protein
MHIQLAKAKDLIIDLDAPLATSVGRPVGNKAAKVVALETATADRVQASIDKCLVEPAHARHGERREVEGDAAQARREDRDQEGESRREETERGFHDLDRRYDKNGYQVLAAHMFCRDMILK